MERERYSVDAEEGEKAEPPGRGSRPSGWRVNDDIPAPQDRHQQAHWMIITTLGAIPNPCTTYFQHHCSRTCWLLIKLDASRLSRAQRLLQCHVHSGKQTVWCGFLIQITEFQCISLREIPEFHSGLKQYDNVRSVQSGIDRTDCTFEYSDGDRRTIPFKSS